MRIAFLTHQFPGVRMGGLGSCTVAAARALAMAGHDVHIFTFTVPPEVRKQFTEDSPAPVTLHDVADLATRVAWNAVASERAAAIQTGGEPAYRLAMGVLLGEAVLAEHAAKAFDVVEAPECEALQVPLILQHRNSRASGLPPLAVVTQIHSGAAVSRRGNGQESTPIDLAIDALEAAAIVLADGVVAMTEAVVRETERALGVKRAAVRIPLAVPLEGAYTPPPNDGPVLFVGRLERLKGVDVLVKAAGQFLKACPKARIRFVGPDTPTAPTGEGEEKSMRAWMEKQIPADLRARVEFTGELPPREVTAQMRAARFMALPSVVENFSLVAAQAFGMGRTCVFSDDIGTAEMYGETGIRVPNGNAEALATALESLWKNPATIDALSRAAWERAGRDFNRDGVVAKQIAFYEQSILAAQSKRRDLSDIPSQLATALLEPLANMTHFACGTQNAGTVRTPGARLVAIMEQIAAEMNKPWAKVLLYGAGRHSSRLLTEKHLWEAAGHEVAGFIDDGKRWAVEGTHLGLPVVSRQILIEQVAAGTAVPPIVLSTDTFEHQFWEQTRELREHGVRVFRLYS